VLFLRTSARLVYPDPLQQPLNLLSLLVADSLLCGKLQPGLSKLLFLAANKLLQLSILLSQRPQLICHVCDSQVARSASGGEEHHGVLALVLGD